MSVLRKKVVQIPFIGALNQRLDPKTLGAAPWFEVLQNLQRTRTGEWGKRNGFAPLTSPGFASSGHPVRVLAGLNGALLAVGAKNIERYSTARASWDDITVASFRDDRVTTHQLVDVEEPAGGNVPNAAGGDVAYGNGLLVTAYSAKNSSAVADGFVAVTEEASRQQLGLSGIGPIGFGGNAQNMRVVYAAAAAAFLVFYVEESGAASVLKCTKYSSSMAFVSTATVASNLLGTATGTPWYDIQLRSDTGRIVIAYRGTGPNLRAMEWSPTTMTANVASTVVVGTDVAANGLGWVDRTHTGGTTNPRLATAVNSATGVVLRELDWQLLIQVASTTVQASPGDVSQVTGFYDGTQDQVFYEVRHAFNPKYCKVVRGTTSPVAFADFAGAGSLASKPVKVVDADGDRYYILLSHPWEKQPTYFVARCKEANFGMPDIVDRILAGQGQDLHPRRHALPFWAQIATNKHAVPVRQVYSVSATGTTFTAYRRPRLAVVDFAGKLPPAAEAGSLALFPAGMPRFCSGSAFKEIGFNIDPDKPLVVAAAGGTLPDGQYRYVALWAADIDGKRWTSGPSEPSIAITIAGGGVQSINVTIRTPYCIQHYNARLEVYRTPVNGTVYHRLPASLDLPSVNQMVQTGQEITFNDATLDADLVTGLQLYTDGGELFNQPPPPSLHMVMQGARAITIDAESPTDVLASKEIQAGQGIGFHPDVRVRIDADGPNTALGLVGGRVVVFKRQSIYLLTGDWPNALGQGSLPLVEPVARGFGTVQPETICMTSDGVWFKDPSKGLCFLDKGLQVTQPGKPVQTSGANSIVAATLAEDFEQVRFLSALTGFDSPVYDYLEKQWATWVISNPGNPSFTAAAMVNGVYYVGRDSGQILANVPGLYTDNAVNYAVRWSLRLSLGGIEGIQRLYRLVLLGQMTNQVLISSSLTDDFGTVVTETKAQFFTQNAGRDFNLPGNFSATFRPANQRTASAVLAVAFTTSNEGVRFSSLSAEIGLRGLQTVRKNRSSNMA